MCNSVLPSSLTRQSRGVALAAALPPRRPSFSRPHLHPPGRRPLHGAAHRPSPAGLRRALRQARRRGPTGLRRLQQLYRLRLSHATLASRPHFVGFHLSLLLPLALPGRPPPPPAPAALPRRSPPPSSSSLLPKSCRRRPPAHLAALLAATVLSSSPFAGSVASLPAWRSARAFWFGTDQPRTGLAVLASSAPTRLLLHLVVLVSSAASILQCCGFVDGPELEVKLPRRAGLLLASQLPAAHISRHVLKCLATRSQLAPLCFS
ncbi:hypothetical protein ZWY2020_006636 [Hordeum vulgare]|nr:hypothetical protein ZWY2020_006636 [Hordeum vulgare]